MNRNVRRRALTFAVALAMAPWMAPAWAKNDKDKDNKKQNEQVINQVPEPESLGLVAIGLVALWAASRRRKD